MEEFMMLMVQIAFLALRGRTRDERTFFEPKREFIAA
jgi:hypothetical protein